MYDNDVFKTSNDGRFRVLIVTDIDAEEPYDVSASPLLRVRAEHIQVGHNTGDGRPQDDDSAIEAAVKRWGSPSGSEWRYVEKYLRAFYGVTQIETWYSDNYWYVTYDSAAWREYTGNQPGSADMTEYRAWVEGEVYGVIVERKDTWATSDGRTEDMWTQTGVEDYASWSIYGYEYVTQVATERLAEAIADNEEAADV